MAEGTSAAAMEDLESLMSFNEIKIVGYLCIGYYRDRWTAL